MKEFVNCEHCKREAVNNSPMTLRPKMAWDIAEVNSYNACEATEVRHWVDAIEVLLQYTLLQFINCSLPGRHEHKNGLVVRTRCGLVIRIGTSCARKCLNGWQDVDKQINKLNVRADLIAKIQSLPQLRARFAGIRPRMNRFGAEVIKQSDVMVHTKNAAIILEMCDRIKNPESVEDEDELRIIARPVLKLVEAIGDAERELAAIETAYQRYLGQQRAIDTEATVRKDVQQHLKDAQNEHRRR